MTHLSLAARRLLPHIPAGTSRISIAQYIELTSESGKKDMSRRSVQRGINDLKDVGAVEDGQGPHDGTANSSRWIRLLWSKKQVEEALAE